MNDPAAGTCYKFTVRSAAEAATLIRERLGEHARVLSVRTVPASGIRRLWAAPQLEIIARPERPATAPALPAPVATPGAVAESAAPAASLRSALPAPDLRTLLRRAGFSETLLDRLVQSHDWPGLAGQPLHRGLVETGRHLRELARAGRPAPTLRRAAFLGLPGSGRTSVLCQWLALEVFRRGRTGHVVTAEFDRPNSPGPLPVFCEALGVPLAHFPALTSPATPEGFVYCDLPGLSLRDPAANAAVVRFLETEGITERVLVLNAAYDPAVLRAAHGLGCGLGATHVAFTHLDELDRWGRLWDYVLEGPLQPLLLTTGPSLTGECEEDVADALARRTLPAAESAPPTLRAAA